jgi:tetratricopeptide (TPR) repeat protein
MKKFILLFLLALACAAPLHAQKKTFVRDYTYQASEADSKLTARANATTQMRTNLLRELGEYVHVERTLKRDNTSEEFSQKIEAITAGIVEMKTLDERWDGFTYYIKAEMTVDPKDLERRIADVLNDKQKTKELEEARKYILAAEAENARLRKELEETKNEQQRLALQEKYQHTADILSAGEYFTKGYNAQGNGFNDLAIEYYQKGIALDPDYAMAYNNMGNAYNDLKNPHEAIRCYKKAIALDPNHAMAYNNMGNVYSELGNNNEAIRCYQKAIALDLNSAMVYCNMGIAYKNLGNNNEAIRCYKKAVSIDKNYASAYYSMGIAYYNLRSYNEAIRNFRKTLALEPNNASAYMNMGIVYANLRDYDNAVWHYQQAARLGHYAAQKVLREIGEGW